MNWYRARTSGHVIHACRKNIFSLSIWRPNIQELETSLTPSGYIPMEAAGLAVGVAGLLGIFSACVDCFEYIQFGRQFGQDYGKCLLKLDVARLQLCRWGAAIGLGTVEPALLKQQVTYNSSQELRLAQNILRQILDCFEDAKRISARYMGHVSANSTDGATDLVVYDADTADINPEYRSMHLTMRELAQQRQKAIGVRKKAMWALYEKKKFDRLIEDITGFIGQVVNLFPAAQDDQRALCKLEVAAFPETQDLALLKDIAHEDDQILSDEIKREMEHRGHVYTDWEADQDSKVWAGDDNAFGVKGKSHTFARFSVSGNAIVHLGNVNRGAQSRR